MTQAIEPLVQDPETEALIEKLLPEAKAEFQERFHDEDVYINMEDTYDLYDSLTHAEGGFESVLRVAVRCMQLFQPPPGVLKYDPTDVSAVVTEVIQIVTGKSIQQYMLDTLKGGGD